MNKKLLWFASAILLTTASLLGPSAPAAACPSNFCTSAQRLACAQTCHFKGIGLWCDSTTCTSLCICGSVPPG
ncbi:MAG TPA: hypothetical protein VLX28_15430 [Thermoanaerobaculia bacterium]|nr:hypothetical protein [Thermoanaerobaculia bacterium]